MFEPVHIALTIARMHTYGETFETAAARALLSMFDEIEQTEATMGHA